MESKVKYGQELGPNLIKIAKNLIQNQDLCKLIKNTDMDPLNKEKHPDNIDGLTLLNKNIRVVPLITSEEETIEPKIILVFDGGDVSYSNSDNEQLSLTVNIYCSFETWLITGETLRPFAIMSEVRKSLQDKRINGLGEIVYQGFDISTLTEEMGCYILRFRINAFS